MITIRRSSNCPPELRGSPTDRDYFDARSVGDELWNMQNTKCCYCECVVPRRGQGRHVEHFRPKETPRFAHLRNDWKNLLLACPQCNGNKGEEFPETKAGRPILIDPSSPHIDPEDHITFITGEQDFDIPGQILERNGSRRGRKTIEVLRLWHPDYVRARVRFFKKEVLPVYKKFTEARESNQPRKLASSIADFHELLSSRSPFAAFVRALARNRHLDCKGITIPVGAG